VIIAVQVHRSRVCSEQKRHMALWRGSTSRDSEHGCSFVNLFKGDL
jgi:hypothetical protein